METVSVAIFEQWRDIARAALRNRKSPDQFVMLDGTVQSGLFDGPGDLQSDPPHVAARGNTPAASVPKQFLTMAQRVCCHRSEDRFQLLYRILWRLTFENRALLDATTDDDDVYQMATMEKAVRRDSHKMKAFVRFREVNVDGTQHFIAWHRPEHRTVRLTSPFFARRFPSMIWSILTPDESVHWNLSELSFGPGVPQSAAPAADAAEDLWRTYYRSIFNPARIKLKAMKAEMPVRHWSSLPETQDIDLLLNEAPRRVAKMVEASEGIATSAASFLPPGLSTSGKEASHTPRQSSTQSLQGLRLAAASCQGCPLCGPATQTVFGTGPADARIVLVGEQPGDEEDLAGQPFIGPAGQLLDRAMEQAGLRRDEVYVTNTVKHFKFEPRGKRRIHAKPDVREVTACRPWLEAELSLIRPAVTVCLGATAANAILGPQFRISAERGQPCPSRWSTTIATYHPSAVLRVPDGTKREQLFEALVTDMRSAANLAVRDRD